MVTHSSTLAWKMPWTEEPGGLQTMGLQRGRYNWSDLAHTHMKCSIRPWWSKLSNEFFSSYIMFGFHILLNTLGVSMVHHNDWEEIFISFFHLFSPERHQFHFSRQSKEVWRLLLTQEAATYGGGVTLGPFSTMKAKAMFLATLDFCPIHPCYK